MFTGYISVPMNVDWQKYVGPISNSYKNLHLNFTWWVRGTPYTPDNLRNADFLIVVLPDNRFIAKWEDITTGVKSEIQEAIFMKKKIYLSYRTTSGGVYLYNTKINADGVFGITGYITADHIVERHEESETTELINRRKSVKTVSRADEEYDNEDGDFKLKYAPDYVMNSVEQATKIQKEHCLDVYDVRVLLLG